MSPLMEKSKGCTDKWGSTSSLALCVLNVVLVAVLWSSTRNSLTVFMGVKSIYVAPESILWS